MSDKNEIPHATQKDKHPSTRPFIFQEYANVYRLDFTIVSN